jgi:diguanylate cyclase (GGDEF)-like protein
MKQIFKQIARNAAIVTNTFFSMARQADYKTLSRYLLDINQMHDLNNILRKASHCLKDILDCRLFALAVQDGKKLNVWIDPAVYRHSLSKIIARDFDDSGGYHIHLTDQNQTRRPRVIAFQEEDILSYVLMDDNCYARLYLLPKRKMASYHIDLINIIVKSLGIALKNHMNIKRLQNDVAFDPLTNCYNRREFSRLIEHNIANAHRHDKPLSLIMFDIDHFKQVNDTYGHQAGDMVLKAVADLINGRIRKGDYLIRYGGEEFVVVSPDTKRTNAIELAERLRKCIAEQRIRVAGRAALNITASFGISTLRSGSDQHSLLKEADEMLYKAKTGGRNMVMPQLKLRVMKQTSFPEQRQIMPLDNPAYAG